MTSVVTFPTNFKLIKVWKHQIKFKTVNGTEGTIELNTNDNKVRNVREEFWNIHINYVNWNHSIPDGIEYSIKLNEKLALREGEFEKIRKVGRFLSQAKFYKCVMLAKILLCKMNILSANWRVEKYIFWKHQKNVATFDEIEFQEENQSGSFLGLIFEKPPDVNTVIRN